MYFFFILFSPAGGVQTKGLFSAADLAGALQMVLEPKTKEKMKEESICLNLNLRKNIFAQKKNSFFCPLFGIISHIEKNGTFLMSNFRFRFIKIKLRRKWNQLKVDISFWFSRYQVGRVKRTHFEKNGCKEETGYSFMRYLYTYIALSLKNHIFFRCSGKPYGKSLFNWTYLMRNKICHNFC